MLRYRKKAHLQSKSQQPVIVLDSSTEQVENPRPACKKLKSMQGAEGVVNPYEKIRQIPEIMLTKQQMNGDPIQVILKLQQKYREYGAVKIRTPVQWNPSFNFKYSEKPITTRIQKIHRLKQGKAFDQKVQEYSIKSFTDFAINYETGYRFKFEKVGSGLEAQMEYEYWRIVNGVGMVDQKLMEKYKATIEYAADLPTHHFGSGFPVSQTSRAKDEHFNYATNYFNLNNIYKSPKSILKICETNNERISGVTIPWMYMGMQFSTFCWHVEDLWLNSINYSHKGATKTWYVIPESDKQQFDAFVLKKTGKRELLNSITFMIDPIELMENGIKVFKAYQRPREYILTLFGAYHCGFSQGFNVGEAVNVGTIDSLAVIRKAQQFNAANKNSHKPPVICYEWLVAANLKNPNLNQQILSSQYQIIANHELSRVKKFLQRKEIKGTEVVNAQLKYDRLSCQTCKYYQYLSVMRCTECERKFCLEHAEKCCGKGFIFVMRECDKVRRKCGELIRQSIG